MRSVGGRGGGEDKQGDGATNSGCVHSFCWGESVVGGLGVGKIVYKQIIFRSDSSLDCKKQKRATKYNQFKWVFCTKKKR